MVVAPPAEEPVVDLDHEVVAPGRLAAHGHVDQLLDVKAMLDRQPRPGEHETARQVGGTQVDVGAGPGLSVCLGEQRSLAGVESLRR